MNELMANPLGWLLSNPALALSNAQPDFNTVPMPPAPGMDPGIRMPSSTLTSLGGNPELLDPGMNQLPPALASILSGFGGDPGMTQPPPGLLPETAAPSAATEDVGGADIESLLGGSPAMGSAGTGTGVRQRPIPPPPLDERSLYPSMTQTMLQGAIPGIGALIAALAGGGKAAATGLLHGAAQGNAYYNEDIRRRGLLKYQMEQQQYARDHQLWQEDLQQTEHKAAVIGALAEKARSFANPEDGKAWLRAQVPIYAPQNINAMDAWPAAAVGGDDRRRELIQKKVDAVIAQQIELAKAGGYPLDISKLPDQISVRFEGVTKPLRDWMTIAESPPLVVPEGAVTSAAIRDVQEEVRTHVQQYTQTTGHPPDALQRSQFERDAWSKWEHDKKLGERAKEVTLRNAELEGSLRLAQINKLNRSGEEAITPQQDMFARNRVGELMRNKNVVLFNWTGQLYDNFMSTINDPHPNAITDQTAIAEFIRAKHPGSSRVGDQETLRIELARPGMDNLKVGIGRVLNGQVLEQSQRDQMIEVMRRSYEGQKAGIQTMMDNYGQMLQKRGIQPGDYILSQFGASRDPVKGYWLRAAETQAAQEKASTEADALVHPKITLGAGGRIVPTLPPGANVTATPAQRRDQRSTGQTAAPGAPATEGGVGMKFFDPRTGKEVGILGYNPDGTVKVRETGRSR